MVIIIDGYNLLKQLHPHAKENLKWHKKTLIKALGLYKKIKTGAIKEIILVFDGGVLAHATREVHQGIVVLESGHKKTADDWIIDYSERFKKQEITVVSMDRELCLACERHGSFSMSVFDFAHAVKLVIQQERSVGQDYLVLDPSLKKLDCDDVITDIDMPGAPEGLDALMAQASDGNLPRKSDADAKVPKKQEKISKSDKEILKKIKKIY